MMLPLLALFFQSAPAAVPTPAPTATPACTVKAAPPAGLEAWNDTLAVSTGTIEIGKPTHVTLVAATAATFVLPPEKVPAAGTTGGVFRFTVAKAGIYRIALKTAGWIDVVSNGKSLKSSGHTEGPLCSKIRKIVDFDLTAGDYSLQLSGGKDLGTRVLIVAK